MEYKVEKLSKIKYKVDIKIPIYYRDRIIMELDESFSYQLDTLSSISRMYIKQKSERMFVEKLVYRYKLGKGTHTKPYIKGIEIVKKIENFNGIELPVIEKIIVNNFGIAEYRRNKLHKLKIL